LGEGGERGGAGLADLDLGEDPGELAGNGSVHGPGDLQQRAVEALSGLDADGEHVECVGQGAL